MNINELPKVDHIIPGDCAKLNRSHEADVVQINKDEIRATIAIGITILIAAVVMVWLITR